MLGSLFSGVLCVPCLGLELGDGLVELGERGRDVGKLDDVGGGGLGQLSELREGVRHALLGLEHVGELRAGKMPRRQMSADVDAA